MQAATEPLGLLPAAVPSIRTTAVDDDQFFEDALNAVGAASRQQDARWTDEAVVPRTRRDPAGDPAVILSAPGASTGCSPGGAASAGTSIGA